MKARRLLSLMLALALLMSMAMPDFALAEEPEDALLILEDEGEEFVGEISDDVIWEAPGQESDFVVYFDVEGENYDCQRVAEGKMPSRPADPSREGCEFAFWHLPDDEDCDFFAAGNGVYCDIMLVAAWTEAQPVVEETTAVEEAAAEEGVPAGEETPAEEGAPADEEDAPVAEEEPPVVEEETDVPVEEAPESPEDALEVDEEPSEEAGEMASEGEEALTEPLAEEEAEGDAALLEGEFYDEFEEHISLSGGKDNDALFEGYFNRAVAWLDLGPGRRRRTFAATQAGRESLEETSLERSLMIYDALRSMIKDVADGKRTSTEFEFSADDLGLEDTWWTKEDLGLEDLNNKNVYGPAMLEKAGIDTKSILNALLADCPYDLYWFDKTKGWNCPYGWSYSQNQDGETVSVGMLSIRFNMHVSQDYGTADPYTVNVLPAQINAAVTNIGSIVSENASLGDYAKLKAYANAICGLVDYNHTAAENHPPYGDPWQLVYIFDGDPDSKVVCEGYSKGFKYLCDLSAFSDGAGCVLMTGDMAYGTGAGPHMWNVVRMGDGRRYLVDITNSDGGESCDYRLFMKGCVIGASSYACDGVEFTYDEDTLATYGANSPWLVVSEKDYGVGYAVSVGAAESGTASASCETADAGSAVTLTLTPGSGYTAAQPTVKRGSRTVPVTEAGENQWSFTMPYGDVAVTATFEEVSVPEFEIDDNGVLTKYNGQGGDVVIPEGVTSIGADAFQNCATLTSVDIPSAVIEIANGAFPHSAETLFVKCNSYAQTWARSNGYGNLAVDPSLACGYRSTDHTGIVVDELVAATCLDAGRTVGSHCNVCGDVLTAQETVAALGHDLVHHDAKAPTCTEKGWDAYDTCSRCDYTTYVEKAALSHDIVHHDAKVPTCTEIGWDAYDACSRCDYTTYAEKAALGHDIVHHDAKAPTCTEKGWDAYDTCSRCDYTTKVEKAALGHDLVHHEAQAPTCTEKGWNAYDTCSRCDYTTYVEKAALGHDIVHHDAKAPTCTEIGWDAYNTCSRCDYTTYVEKAALDHDLVHHEAKAPTCTEVGWDAYDTCKREGCDYTTYVEIDALDHDLVHHDAQAPTCTEIGWDAYDTCKREGCDYTTYVEIDALDHDLVHHDAQAPTCMEKGWDAYNTCSRCDYTTYVEIAALGHDLEQHEGKAASCTEIGWDAYDTCKREGCDYTTYVEKAALGHAWSVTYEWSADNSSVTATRVCGNDPTHVETETVDTNSVTNAATCETKGETIYTSGAFKNEAFKVQTKTIEDAPALNHDLVHHDAKTPTCTEKGWDAYDTCSRCDYTTYVEIAALGHDLEQHEAKAATCTEIGWDAYDTCKREGCDYTTYVEIAALGHDLEQHKAKAATCTEVGWDAYDACSRCDCTTYVEKPALNHDLVHHNAKAATCTEKGWDAYDTCSRCNYTTYVEKPALKHNLVHHDAKAATCTEIGWNAYDTCSRCNYTTYVEKSALKHNLVHHNAKAPTCTEIGWGAYDACSRCNYTTYVEKAKLAHTPVTVAGYAATYEKAGLTDGTKCSVCGTWITPQKAIAQLEYPTWTLSKAKGTLTVNVGDKVRIVPKFATSAGAKVTSYKSAKKKLASVNADGLVTGVAEGSTKITVTTNNKKKKATITVKVVDPYKPTGVGFKQGKSVTVKMGQPLQLEAVLKPAKARTTLTWKSSKPKVAAVDKNGKITPVSEGTAKITVTTKNKKKATITVKVVDPYKPTGIVISQGKSATLKVGQTLQLEAVLKPTGAKTKLTWKSDKKAIAAVDSKGKVTAKKKGKAKITVTTANKKKFTITITVTG